MKRLLSCLLIVLLLTACSGGGTNLKDYPIIESSSERLVSRDDINYPEASGNKVNNNCFVSVDYSNTNHGYILAKTTTSDHKKLKLRVGKGEDEYTYDIPVDDTYISYPLTFGNGTYHIKIYENLEGSSYAIINSFDINVSLDDELDPFLYPSIIVDYNEQTKAIDKAYEICEGINTNIERVYAVYAWIVKNIKYDYDKVEEVSNKYVLPIIDETLSIKKGICFDYAALMTCMLRVQGIPCKVVTGYVSEGYHAWVEVYIKDVGWIHPEVYFGNKDWTMIDPTYDAMGGADYSENYEDLYKY